MRLVGGARRSPPFRPFQGDVLAGLRSGDRQRRAVRPGRTARRVAPHPGRDPCRGLRARLRCGQPFVRAVLRRRRGRRGAADDPAGRLPADRRSAGAGHGREDRARTDAGRPGLSLPHRARCRWPRGRGGRLPGLQLLAGQRLRRAGRARQGAATLQAPAVARQRPRPVRRGIRPRRTPAARQLSAGLLAHRAHQHRARAGLGRGRCLGTRRIGQPDRSARSADRGRHRRQRVRQIDHRQGAFGTPRMRLPGRRRPASGCQRPQDEGRRAAHRRGPRTVARPGGGLDRQARPGRRAWGGRLLGPQARLPRPAAGRPSRPVLRAAGAERRGAACTHRRSQGPLHAAVAAREPAAHARTAGRLRARAHHRASCRRGRKLPADAGLDALAGAAGALSRCARPPPRSSRSAGRYRRSILPNEAASVMFVTAYIPRHDEISHSSAPLRRRLERGAGRLRHRSCSAPDAGGLPGLRIDPARPRDRRRRAGLQSFGLVGSSGLLPDLACLVADIGGLRLAAWNAGRVNRDASIFGA
ncbi:hypothetical protein VARIO8X_70106 [Burkholderiales bacterium 8X]|nr:hypothetical protein VARIO8X_70106 [Burkholderiales bacterium 8X]